MIIYQQSSRKLCAIICHHIELLLPRTNRQLTESEHAAVDKGSDRDRANNMLKICIDWCLWILKTPSHRQLCYQSTCLCADATVLSMWDQFTIATLLVVLGSKGISGPFRIKFSLLSVVVVSEDLDSTKEIKLNGTAHMDAMQQFTRFGRNGVMDDNDFKGVWLALQSKQQQKNTPSETFVLSIKALHFTFWLDEVKLR